MSDDTCDTCTKRHACLQLQCDGHSSGVSGAAPVTAGMFWEMDNESFVEGVFSTHDRDGARRVLVTVLDRLLVDRVLLYDRNEMLSRMVDEGLEQSSVLATGRK